MIEAGSLPTIVIIVVICTDDLYLSQSLFCIIIFYLFYFVLFLFVVWSRSLRFMFVFTIETIALTDNLWVCFGLFLAVCSCIILFCFAWLRIFKFLFTLFCYFCQTVRNRVSFFGERFEMLFECIAVFMWTCLMMAQGRNASHELTESCLLDISFTCQFFNVKPNIDYQQFLCMF